MRRGPVGRPQQRFVFHPKPFLETGVNSVVLRERGSGLTIYSAKLVRQEAGASVLLGKKNYLFLAATPDNNILQELIGQVVWETSW